MNTPADIVKHFRQKLQFNKTYTDKDFDRLISFGTYTFDDQIRSRCQADPSALLNLVKLFEFRVNRQLLGNNLNRHLLKQPLTYAWIDFDGSRHSKQISTSSFQFAHVHSLTCLEPEYAHRYYKIIDAMKSAPIAGILDIKFSPYDHNRKSLEYLADYCMKGYKAIPNTYKLREDLWTIIPFGHGSSKNDKPTQSKLNLIKRSDRLFRKMNAQEARTAASYASLGIMRPLVA